MAPGLPRKQYSFSQEYREILIVLPAVKGHTGLLDCSLDHIFKPAIISKIALYLTFKSIENETQTTQFII